MQFGVQSSFLQGRLNFTVGERYSRAMGVQDLRLGMGVGAGQIGQDA